jgi:hypothetical protein
MKQDPIIKEIKVNLDYLHLMKQYQLKINVLNNISGNHQLPKSSRKLVLCQQGLSPA